jgi:hypothetical protein
MSACNFTILMPCLNEAETLAACIRKASEGLRDAGVSGEVLIADNGSTDGSIEIAEGMGARVVRVKEKGYGSALRGGIDAARGRWMIMGDADDSYDFSAIRGFVERLQAGDDLVMGCRLPAGGGTIMPGAMPWKNRWLGNPVLSTVGRVFYKTPVRDFHCGLRGFSREACLALALQTSGMEFASEMVMKASLAGLRISEVPITLHKDGRNRPPHLRPWRDGWRHLRFMLIYSPRWLYLLPGIAAVLIGGGLAIATYFGRAEMAGAHLDTGTFASGCAGVLAGVQFIAFAFVTKVFAIGEGLLPQDQRFARWFRIFTLERGLIFSVLVACAGCVLFSQAFLHWRESGFGDLPFAEHMRRVIAGTTLFLLGVQGVATSFLMSILGLRTAKRRPPATYSPEDGVRE